MPKRKSRHSRLVDTAIDPRYTAAKAPVGPPRNYILPQEQIPDFFPPLKKRKPAKRLDVRPHDPSKPRAVQNPLRLLADQMGLHPEFLATLSGIAPSRVVRAIQDPADGETLADFIVLLGALRIRLRVEAAPPPFTFWINTGPIDALMRDNKWRRIMRMCPCPHSRADVAITIKSLHKRGLSYKDIAAYLTRHYIPGARGGYKWNNIRVYEYIVRRRTVKVKEFVPKEARTAHRRSWRGFVVSLLLQRFFAGDLLASLRYGIGAEHFDDHVKITASQRVPLFIREEIEKTLRKLAWFPAHEWGMGERQMPP